MYNSRFMFPNGKKVYKYFLGRKEVSNIVSELWYQSTLYLMSSVSSVFSELITLFRKLSGGTHSNNSSSLDRNF